MAGPRTTTSAAEIPPGRAGRARHSLVDSDLADAVTATIHPSAILRGEPEQREIEFAAFVDDLRFVASLL